MNHEFAGGVNRIVYHVRPQRYTPATTWPGMGFSAANVSFSNAVVTNKRLAEAGPAYRALVFDQFRYPTSNAARGGLSVEAAEKILG